MRSPRGDRQIRIDYTDIDYPDTAPRIANSTVWINNRNISDFCEPVKGYNQISCPIPVSASLPSGRNTLEALLITENGNMVRTEGSFSVNAELPAPKGLNCLPGSQAVTLDWLDQRAPTFQHYHVERSSASDGPWETLARIEQAMFMDVNPLTTGYYRVSVVDEGGVDSAPSRSIPCATVSTVAEEAQIVGQIAFTDVSGGIQVAYDGSDAVGYRIERGRSQAGPFESLFGEHALFAGLNYIDRSATIDTDYFYRVVPVNADGADGKTAVGGPVARGADSLVAPAGLAYDVKSGRVIIRWDRLKDDAISGYRLYRRDPTVDWSLISSTGASKAPNFVEEAKPTSGVRLYAVSALFGEGHESELVNPSVSVLFFQQTRRNGRWHRPLQSGQRRVLPQERLHPRECGQHLPLWSGEQRRLGATIR